MKFPLSSEEDNFQVTSLLSFEPILECGPLDPSRYPQLSHLSGLLKGFEPQGDKPGHCLKPNEVGSSHPQITLREVLSSTEHQQGSRKPGPLDWKSFSVLSSQEKFSPSTFHPFFLPLEIRRFTTPFYLSISPLSLLQTLLQSNHLHTSHTMAARMFAPKVASLMGQTSAKVARPIVRSSIKTPAANGRAFSGKHHLSSSS